MNSVEGGAKVKVNCLELQERQKFTAIFANYLHCRLIAKNIVAIVVNALITMKRNQR